MIGVLLMVSILGYYGLSHAVTSSQVLEEELRKLEVVSDVQILFSIIHDPVKDFLAHVNDPDECARQRQQYEKLSRGMNRKLKQLERHGAEMVYDADVIGKAGDGTDSSQMIAEIRKSYEELDRIATMLMVIPPVVTVRKESMMAAMDRIAASAVQRLETLKRANRAIVLWASQERARGRSIARYTLLIVLVIVFIGALLGVYFSVSVLRPLDELREGTRRIASGEFESRLDIRTNDEISDLSRDFNSMAAELQDFYASMDRKVIERTREVRERSSNLKDERQKLKSIIYSMAEGVIFVNAEGSIALCNRAAEQILNIRSDALLGEPFEEHLPTAIQTAVAAVLNHDPLSDDRMKLQQPDRLDNLSAVCDEDGQLRGVLIVSEDTTERNRLERDREELYRQIHQQDKLAIIGQIAANVAHELNTPLGAILLHAQALEEQVSSPQNADTAGEVVSLAKRCRTIVKSLLTFSRKGGSTSTRLEVGELLRRGLKFLESDFASKNICPEAVSDGKYYILADENRIQQVFLNVFRNAIDACGDGGMVRVELEASNGSVIIRIQDDGSGIPAESRDKIFEPFYTTKPPGKGTGLGLPICRQILEDYRGTITVAGEPGAGAAFVIVLPGERR